VAIALCAVLAFVGAFPVAIAFIVRSASVRSWATGETEKLLREQGIVASYALDVRAWPPSVELTSVRVESANSSVPFLECRRARIRLKLLSLLAGKVAIDEIVLDAPRARIVVRDGKVDNLAVKMSGTPSSGPFHAPFATVGITDASATVDLDGQWIEVGSADVDVAVQDDPATGSSFEVALRLGGARSRRSRAQGTGPVAIDEDVLCSAEGRLRIEPQAVEVHWFEATGSADLAAAPDTEPPCGLPSSDKRRVEVSLRRARVGFSDGPSGAPSFDGHGRVRVPLGLAERLTPLPETDGWVAVEGNLRLAQDSVLPELDGTLEARDIRISQFAFAQQIESRVLVRRDVIESPLTTVHLANGTVTLTDTVVLPLARGVRLERTRLDGANLDFTALMQRLGVHPHPHVAWDVRELHAPIVSGTFAPLKLDGDLTVRTYAFGVYDRAADDETRQRLFGISDAQIVARLAIRPDALKFVDTRVKLPHSSANGAYVSIGFDNVLRVELPSISADLEDMSPIGGVALRGRMNASADVGGMLYRPEPRGEIRSITGFQTADVAYGDLSSGHVDVDVTRPEVLIRDVHATKRASAYDVSTARLRFGGSAAMVLDASATSGGLGMRDLLAMFALDDDPRFEGIGATLSTQADVHVALGGAEDACGGGYVGIDAKTRLTGISIYGERFTQGDADLAVRWYDRDQGIAGADVDVRSFMLAKGSPPSTDARASARGATVLGSATLGRGGALSAHLAATRIPLSRVDLLGPLGLEIDGDASGVADISGSLDAFRPDVGFVVRSSIDVSSARVRETAVASSHIDVRVAQPLSVEKRSVRTTRCGALVAPAFDRALYLATPRPNAEWNLDGALLGDTIHLHDLHVGGRPSPNLTGRVSLRGVDLGLLARLRGPPSSSADAETAMSSLGGQLWGELIADDIPLASPSRARARFVLGPTVVSHGSERLVIKPPPEPFTLAADTLTIPAFEVTLDAPNGFRGAFAVSGDVSHLSSDPKLALNARLSPTDLSILQRILPKLDSAVGQIQGDLRVTGKATAPAVSGLLHATAESIAVRGWPAAFADLNLDIRATSAELSATGNVNFGGGKVALEASLPLRGFDLGVLHSRVIATGVRLVPIDGATASVDADLQVTLDPRQMASQSLLPRVTGEVTVDSLDYTRPIALAADLGTLSTRARRTQVDAYDPSLDFLTLDVRIESRRPLVIKNNLVEAQLAIDSGSLDVSGTNQRVGMRGRLRVIPGGRVHFQQADFEVRQGIIRFDDATRVEPNVDVTAVTEYRRYTDTGAATASGVSASGGTGAAAANSTRGGSLWRITLHAYGDVDDLHVEMTSEPSLSQEDIVLLLAMGMTRAELDQLQASSIGASIALNYLGAASGADRAVKQALPIIDDFRFGSAYSTTTGKTEPQLTIGKRLTNDVRASVTTDLSGDQELRSNIEWRFGSGLSVQGTYDNINDVSSSALGNLGADLRWRLEIE
jgi:translocation and assembly module TamB